MSHWKGSIATAQHVASQINERWGKEAVERYDPKANCFTFQEWKRRGFTVKKGEKALKSITFYEIVGEKDTEKISLGA